jgi:manganese-dependent inorganic pyrophosphatase
MEEIYIFGHKKPDTDSVTSAIALAYLKNKQGLNAKPMILDTINTETEFVLKHFGIEVPSFLSDVKVKVEDIDYYNDFFVKENVSILKAYEYIKEKKVTAIPVTDDNNKLLGLVTLKMIANELISGKFEKLKTSYKNILETLKGNEIINVSNEIEGNIIVAAYKSETIFTNVKLEPNTILIVGNRHEIINYAINSKIKLLILTGDAKLADDEIKLAKQNGVNVISTKYDSFYTTKLIGLSEYIYTLLDNIRIQSINTKIYLDNLLEMSLKQGYNNYPVVDEEGECKGLVRITDIKNKRRKQVILVDHNETEQSVTGLDEAEIIEIVDHHKIGDLTTNKPINFRNMGVGSTNTIVYMMYTEARIEIPKDIAGLMFSGIISDTLNFTSPTTTEIDIEAANELANIAQIDKDEYAMEMFKAGTKIDGKTVEEIIMSDLKVFQIDENKVAVSQVFTLSSKQILNEKQKYIETMEKMREAKGYSMIVMFLTDIVKKGSFVLYSENSKTKLEDAFDLKEIEQGIYMDGILSRKKQIIPKLMKNI